MANFYKKFTAGFKKKAPESEEDRAIVDRYSEPVKTDGSDISVALRAYKSRRVGAAARKARGKPSLLDY